MPERGAALPGLHEMSVRNPQPSVSAQGWQAASARPSPADGDGLSALPGDASDCTGQMVIPEEFCLASYDFRLPREQIAQYPPDRRGNSRLMVLDRHPAWVEVSPASGRQPSDADTPRDARFCDLAHWLPPRALLVANNSRVLPARLLGTRASGGKVEFLLLTPLPLVLAASAPDAAAARGRCAEAEGLLRCGGRVRLGEELDFGAGIAVTPLERGPFGRYRVRLRWRGDLAAAFEAAGQLPLPPYIRRPPEREDMERYQTTHAREDKTGSVAAPTAGLHFTPELRNSLEALGFGWTEITLYVGYGTFSPVRVRDIRQHRIHAEYAEVSEQAAADVARARAEGRPVVAIGTTSARVLEGVAALAGEVRPFAGWIDIFLYPGRPFRVTDALLTNFHLPQSSLVMLVSAFAGRRRVLAAYAAAVERGYRFFSYGDAMLIR